QGGFVHTQRCTVAIVGALLVRRTVTDDGLSTNQRWLAGFRACSFDGGFDGGSVVTVNFGDNMPAVGFKALGRIVGKPAFNMTVNGDAIVVPECNQFTQPQGTGQRADFMGNTFHHATIAEEAV